MTATLTLKFRMILMALLAAFGLSLGLGNLMPHSAAAADLPLSVSITGDHTVYSWDSTLHTIRVKNNNSVRVNDVFIDIYDYLLPMDYKSISCWKSGVTLSSSDCRIVDGLGLSWRTRATVAVKALDPGQQVTIYLSGGTTVVLGSGDGGLFADAYHNFPRDTTSDGISSKRVAWNP